jgi:hypothetical protein
MRLNVELDRVGGSLSPSLLFHLRGQAISDLEKFLFLRDGVSNISAGISLSGCRVFQDLPDLCCRA